MTEQWNVQSQVSHMISVEFPLTKPQSEVTDF